MPHPRRWKTLSRSLALSGILVALGGCSDGNPLQPRLGSPLSPSGTVPSRQAAGGTSPAGWAPLARVASSAWEIGGVADMTGDGNPDVVWQNRATRETGSWIMDGTTLAGWVYMGPFESEQWGIGGVADMTADGKSDLVWHNRQSLRTGVWAMNGTTYTGWTPMADFESGDWQIGGVGDMSGDGKSDIVWQNRVTRQTGVWVMDGTRYVEWVPIAPTVSGDWEMGGVADLTGDGHTDVVWQNRATQQTGVWVMDRTRLTGWIEMRKAYSADWEMGGVADLTGDGSPDIVWQDRVAQQTGLWVMKGTTVMGWEPVASVVVSPDSATLTIGAALQLTAAVRDAAGNALTGREVRWASSAAGVATVSSSGVVTAVGSGTALVIATSEEKSDTARIVVPFSTLIDTREGTSTIQRHTFGGQYSEGTLVSINTYGQTFTVGSHRRLDSFAFFIRASSGPTLSIEPMRYRAVIAGWENPTGTRDGGITTGKVWESEMRTQRLPNPDYQEERFNPGIVLETGRQYVAFIVMEPRSSDPSATGGVYQVYQTPLGGAYKRGMMVQWYGNMPTNLAATSGWISEHTVGEVDLSFIAAFATP